MWTCKHKQLLVSLRTLPGDRRSCRKATVSSDIPNSGQMTNIHADDIVYVSITTSTIHLREISIDGSTRRSQGVSSSNRSETSPPRYYQRAQRQFRCFRYPCDSYLRHRSTESWSNGDESMTGVLSTERLVGGPQEPILCIWLSIALMSPYGTDVGPTFCAGATIYR